MKKIILLTIFLGWITGEASKAQINAKVETLSLKNLLDDNTFSFADYSENEVLVLIVTSTYCPFAKSYRERIMNLSHLYSNKGVQFILINPENPQDSPEAMKENAQAYQLPYLLDTEQKVTRQLQATKTPEVFVLQQSLGHFILKYQGAIDDNPQVAEEAVHHFLEEALDALLINGNPANNYQKPVGCMIKN